MNRRKFSPYVASSLPSGFSYPESYLNLSQDLSILRDIKFFSWWFEDCDRDLQDVQEIYKEITGIDNLIPFARDGDWAACFDGNDSSENPRVYVYDLGNIENHYEMDNFDDWLKLVVKECSAV